MITQKRIKELLSYNQETGVLRWKPRCASEFTSKKRCGLWNSRYANKLAGEYINQYGYKAITIDKGSYLSHRIAWIYINGSINAPLDHLDHNRTNNAINNLRMCSAGSNAKNVSIGKNNSFGVFGVYDIGEKFRVRIKSEGILIQLGSFTDFFEACCARKSAEIKYNFHVNHGK